MQNSRVSLNTVGLAEICLVDAIDLSQLDVLLLQSGSGLLVMRGKCLAVTTPMHREGLRMSTTVVQDVPWGEEFDEHQSLGVDGGLEVSIGEVKDVRRRNERKEGERGRRREDMRETHGGDENGRGEVMEMEMEEERSPGYVVYMRRVVVD